VVPGTNPELHRAERTTLRLAQAGGHEPTEPTIQWSDGLPEDMVEMVEIEAQRLAAGNTSVESSVRRLHGPDAVEAEVRRIGGNASAVMALTGMVR